MTRIVDPNKMHFHREFDDFTDLLDWAAKPPKGSRNASRKTGSTSWYGTSSFEEALELARSGWPNGRTLIDEFREKLIAGVAKRVDLVPTIAMTTSVAGMLPHIPNYLAGLPETMYNFTAVRKPTRVMTILTNISASSGISASVITRRGAALCAVTDILETMGVRVEIIVVEATGGNEGSEGTWSVCVKRPEQPLQLDKLAFILSHPSMLRRIFFSVQEQEDANIRRTFNVGSSYGMPRRLDAKTVEKFTKGDGFHFPELHLQEWNDNDQTLNYIFKLITDTGLLEDGGNLE